MIPDLFSNQADASEAPILVVAPHSTFLDGFVVFWSGLPYIVNRVENKKIPFLGKCIEFTQALFVSRWAIAIFGPNQKTTHLYEMKGTPLYACVSIFSTSLFYPLSSRKRFFLPLISAPTGFHDLGLVTSNYYLPSTPKDQSTMRAKLT